MAHTWQFGSLFLSLINIYKISSPPPYHDFYFLYISQSNWGFRSSGNSLTWFRVISNSTDSYYQYCSRHRTNVIWNDMSDNEVITQKKKKINNYQYVITVQKLDGWKKYDSRDHRCKKKFNIIVKWILLLLIVHVPKPPYFLWNDYPLPVTNWLH